MKMKTTSSFETPLLTAASSDSTAFDEWDQAPLVSQVEPLAKLAALVEKLIGSAESGPFRQPVDTMQYPDYLQVIKKPMDLGTIKKKLSSWQYCTATDAFDDVSLVWTNCMTYNEKGYPIHKLAAKYNRACIKFRVKISQECECIYVCLVVVFCFF